MIGSKETLKKILFGAVRSNSIEKIIAMLGLGLDINTQDEHGQTPIFLAALYNHSLMVEKLAELGADLERKDKLGDTILSKIVSKQNPYKQMSKDEQLDMVKLLIKQGAKLTTYSHYALPIHRAIQAQCNLDIIKALLTKEIINDKNCPGRTPLHLAVLVRRADITELLIKCNADIDAQEDEQNTPLMLAASKGYEDIAISLLVNGADPDLKNLYGKTFFDLTNSEEMKSFALGITHSLSTDTEFENKPVAQLCSPNNHLSVKHKIPENRPQFIRPILSDLKSTYNMLPNPNLLIFNTSETSQHSTSVTGSPSPCSSFSGSFTNRFKRALNVDSSDSSGSDTINAKRKKFDHVSCDKNLN